MAMKLIKKTAEYKIFMRGDNRYAIQDSNGKPVNGEEKVRILLKEDLIKVTVPNPKGEAPESEDAADSGDEATEVAAEPEAEEVSEAAAPEAEPEPEVGAEEAEDEGEAESEEKDK